MPVTHDAMWLNHIHIACLTPPLWKTVKVGKHTAISAIQTQDIRNHIPSDHGMYMGDQHREMCG